MTKARSIPDGYVLRGGAAIPTRPKTLGEMQATIAQCKRQRILSDESFARLALKAGWMTDDARAWLATTYPQCTP